MAKKTSIKVRLVPESKPDSAFYYYVKKPSKGEKAKVKLKLKTPLWLRNVELSKFIVGYETMPNNKGGDGALFVKLKNKNKYKM